MAAAVVAVLLLGRLLLDNEPPLQQVAAPAGTSILATRPVGTPAPGEVEANHVVTSEMTAEMVVAAALKAMRDTSFAVDDIRYYAPPNMVVATGYSPQDLDAFGYYLIDGRRFLVSEDGEHWREGYSPPYHDNLLLTDPRNILEHLNELEIGRESARFTTILTGTLDRLALLDEHVTADGAAGVGYSKEELTMEWLRWSTVYATDSVVLAIDNRTGHVTSVREIFAGGGADLPGNQPNRSGQAEFVADYLFSYDRNIDFPAEPMVLSGEEIQVLSDRAETNGDRLVDAIDAYFVANGRYPEHVDPGTVGGFLTGPWPANPLTDSPMVNREKSPGDFYYVPLPDLSGMRFEAYGWDSPATFTERPLATDD